MKLTINCDGGARGNPGPAAAAFVVFEVRDPSALPRQAQDCSGQHDALILREKRGKFLGVKTNNEAEYQAVIEALSYLRNLGSLSGLSVDFFLDSKLVVNQINGLFKVKEPRLRELLWKIHELEQEITKRYPLFAIRYEYIPREKNVDADWLVNDILDKEEKKQ